MWLIKDNNSFLTVLKAGKFEIKLPTYSVSSEGMWPIQAASFCSRRGNKLLLAFILMNMKSPTTGELFDLITTGPAT